MKNKSALKFIFIMGLVSLFADATYEGARSIIGPYLKILGASAAAVGFVAGLGELIGYTFRLLAGIFVDKTKKYWALTIFGYGLNLIAIPLLAFIPENGWIYACGLILVERFGKAVRNPAKNTLVSFAAKEVGVGKGFAIQEALDQIGAFLGPIMLFIILTIKSHGPGDKSAYSIAFLALGIPAVLTMIILFTGKFLYPRPQEFEKTTAKDDQKTMNKAYWYYMAAIAFLAAGFADFPLMAYHFAKKQIITENLIPIFYAGAMGIDAVSALFFGHLYDKKGMTALIISSIISALFAPFVFLFNSPAMPIVGLLLWGIGMGAQESILKAAVATIVSKHKRGTAYGVFNTGFGIFWFLGSWLMGILYDFSLPALVIFSMAAQLLSLPFLIKTKLMLRK